LSEVDETETGSANSLVRPRKGPDVFLDLKTGTSYRHKTVT